MGHAIIIQQDKRKSILCKAIGIRNQATRIDAAERSECSPISQVCSNLILCVCVCTGSAIVSMQPDKRCNRVFRINYLKLVRLFIIFESCILCFLVRTDNNKWCKIRHVQKTFNNNSPMHANIRIRCNCFYFLICVHFRCFGSYFPWPILYVRGERDIEKVIEKMIPHPLNEREKARLRRLIGWKKRAERLPLLRFEQRKLTKQQAFIEYNHYLLLHRKYSIFFSIFVVTFSLSHFVIRL